MKKTHAHQSHIHIRGARTHNLKDISLDIPRQKLVVVTGLSGSGKSSLAFDTLYAEGQRRYVESLSAYARQFLPLMERPDVDSIEGLSPAIAIEQKTGSHNPRSTVGTVTEIHDYLRLLFARTGTPYCPTHHRPLTAKSVAQITDWVLSLPEDTKLMILAPMGLEPNNKQQFLHLCYDLQAQGYVRIRLNHEVYDLNDIVQNPLIDRMQAGEFQLDVVIDRLKVRTSNHSRLAESIETALRVAQGKIIIANLDTQSEERFSSHYACPECDYQVGSLEPKLFSFNNPTGACPHCDGLGQVKTFDPQKVVPTPELGLADGAVYGWDYRNPIALQNIASLAKHYHFDPHTPFQDLPESIQQIILYGSGEEKIKFSYDGRTKTQVFEGVIPSLNRRLKNDQNASSLQEELDNLRTLRLCPECHGSRLRLQARHVMIGNDHSRKSLHDIEQMSLHDCLNWFERTPLDTDKQEVAKQLTQEVINRLRFLNNVGLSYLSLNRNTTTISGGEAQRIRLASQIGSSLSGVMYVLDEPSIGLHQRDNARLIDTLLHLRDQDNSVIVVEHDEDMINAADYLVDLGPGAGEHGGQIIATGTPEEVKKNPQSLTGQWLTKKRTMPKPAHRPIKPNHTWLNILDCHGNNLKHVDLRIPLGRLVGVSGVSGSGKSTLINETLAAICTKELNRAHTQPMPYQSIQGLEHLDKAICVDQSPIGRTPRSNPATYTGLFTPIRELFANTEEARARGYEAGRFSFNVKGGRCEACQGDGAIKVEMHFMPDMYVPCELCEGKRYNRETLEIRYRGKTIHDVLDMTVSQALEFFQAIPSIARKLQTLVDVGLAYVRLGQSATTLSGGEAQRIKLAFELAKKDTGRTLYILDEPTTGLHFEDIAVLSHVLQRLVEAGNTVVVIEHNLDMLAQMDWLIDMGPEGGDQGGYILAEGTVKAVSKNPRSVTAPFLKP